MVLVKAEGAYSMGHSNGLYLFDSEGYTRVLARDTAGVKAPANDVRQLLT